MIKKVVLVFISLVYISFGQTVCPLGWQRFYDSCYFFADDYSADWTESAHYCMIHHFANLAVIDSRAEDMMLQDHLRHLYKAGSDHHVLFWLGASDSDSEGSWQWYTSDKPLTWGYQNWKAGQPQNREGEDCLCYWGPANFVAWEDHYCTSQGHAICEKNSSTLAVVG